MKEIFRGNIRGARSSELNPHEVYLLLVDDLKVPVKLHKYPGSCDNHNCVLYGRGCYLWIGQTYCCKPVEDIVE